MPNKSPTRAARTPVAGRAARGSWRGWGGARTPRKRPGAHAVVTRQRGGGGKAASAATSQPRPPASALRIPWGAWSVQAHNRAGCGLNESPSRGVEGALERGGKKQHPSASPPRSFQGGGGAPRRLPAHSPTTPSDQQQTQGVRPDLLEGGFAGGQAGARVKDSLLRLSWRTMRRLKERKKRDGPVGADRVRATGPRICPRSPADQADRRLTHTPGGAYVGRRAPGRARGAGRHTHSSRSRSLPPRAHMQRTSSSPRCSSSSRYSRPDEDGPARTRTADTRHHSQEPKKMARREMPGMARCTNTSEKMVGAIVSGWW